MASPLAGPWGANVFAFIQAQQLLVESEDTAEDLIAGQINQLDPNADIFQLLANSIPKWSFRYSGETAAAGPLLIGGMGSPTPGYQLEVLGNTRIDGNLVVTGTISGVTSVTAARLERDMTNGDSTTLAVGEIVQIIAGVDTVARTLATSLATVDAFGVVLTNPIPVGSADAVCFAGTVPIQFETGLILGAGQRVYLSPTTAGAVTNVAPSSSGQVVADVGVITDVSTYVGTTIANSKADVFIDKKAPVPIF